MPSDLKELTVWGQRSSVTEASFQFSALSFFSPKSKASSAVDFLVLAGFREVLQKKTLYDNAFKIPNSMRFP